MSSSNRKAITIKTYTHEGGAAFPHMTSEMLLRRSVMATMLGENQFYESGIEISERIKELIPLVEPDIVRQIALDARNKMHLRHVPLLIIREMARHPECKKYVSDLLYDVIQRADELAEFLAIYWKEGKCPISAQIKKGLARAYCKFNAYNLAKYNRDKVVKLKDVMFLTHPKPFHTKDDIEHEVIVPGILKPRYKRGPVKRHLSGKGQTWKDLIENKLEIPDTWEVGISACRNDIEKKLVFERLMMENKLGGMALLRNLRKMLSVGVNERVIKAALLSMKTEKILPFRFVTAATHAMSLEPELEGAMFKCLEDKKDSKLSGRTVLLIDVSGSMNSQVSSKSESSRIDVACGLAILARELCEDVEIYSFSISCVTIPPRRGFALRDAIIKSQDHMGTYLARALDFVNAKERTYDRIIVFTDEQSHDDINQVRIKTKNAYMINIASNKYGVGYGDWVHIDGFSEAVLDYIYEYEKLS